MKRSLILAAIAAVSLLAEDQQSQDPNQQDSTNTVKSEKKSRIRLAGISLGAGYSHFSGYPFYPGHRPLFLDSYYYGALDTFYFPGYWNGYQRGPEMGEVKLHSRVLGAEVYLNGGYAGYVYFSLLSKKKDVNYEVVYEGREGRATLPVGRL